MMDFPGPTKGLIWMFLFCLFLVASVIILIILSAMGVSIELAMMPIMGICAVLAVKFLKEK